MATFKAIETSPTINENPEARAYVYSCLRCEGMLIPESLFDLLDNSGEMRRWAFRCIQCGDVVDSLILKHRTSDDLPNPKQPHQRRWAKMQSVNS